jgi:hypothetical protein
MDSNGQQWTAMDSNGQQWTAMDSNDLTSAISLIQRKRLGGREGATQMRALLQAWEKERNLFGVLQQNFCLCPN